MKATVAILLALTCSTLSASAAVGTSSKVTPVQKVIQLMEGMVEKGKKEKHDEQVQFAAYKQFCDDTAVEKTRSIAEASDRIEQLQADIEKYDNEAAKLGNEIAKHDDDIATWQGDVKASTSVREIEHNDYLDTHKDYSESIQALKEAIVTLKANHHDVEQTTAVLTQLTSSPLLPEGSKRVIDNLLTTNYGLDENLAVSIEQQQPQAAAWGTVLDGLIEMVQKLVEKFQDEKTELERQETEARQAFELLSQDLAHYIETATKARIAKAEAKTAAQESSGAAKNDQEDTTATRDDDAKYLSDLTATCQQKSAAFEERQELRAG